MHAGCSGTYRSDRHLFFLFNVRSELGTPLIARKLPTLFLSLPMHMTHVHFGCGAGVGHGETQGRGLVIGHGLAGTPLSTAYVKWHVPEHHALGALLEMIKN